MTRFWREGFYRTSPLGTLHWVEGHWVERDDWDRSSGYGYSFYAKEQLASLGVTDSCTSKFVNPNAKCPVCGEGVFFYQNEFGSRVYFDELGPPWPKHPCTDNSEYQIAKKRKGKRDISPSLREREVIDAVLSWSDQLPLSTEDEFFEKYGTKPWGCWHVIRRVRGVGKTLLILSSVNSERTMYLGATRLPRAISNGSMVFYRRLRLAYFDSTSMEPKECTVDRLNGAKEFIEMQFGM